jgi:hypothetical protein
MGLEKGVGVINDLTALGKLSEPYDRVLVVTGQLSDLHEARLAVAGNL